MNCLISGMSIRAIGRFIGCSPNTVSRKIDTLGRQTTAFHSRLQKSIILKEAVAADGFESFVQSQYFPNNFNILVGKKSQFLYFFNYVQLHRKGRMTEYQKKKAGMLKEILILPEHNQVIQFLELKRSLTDMVINQGEMSELDVYTDEKREYRSCIDDGSIPVQLWDREFKITHNTICSTKRRTKRNELFPVNYMDREFRKDSAEHRRETTCFARDVNNSVARMSIYQFYHNYLKAFRINREKEKTVTHADMAGIDRDNYRSMMAHLFTKRFFLSHLELHGHWEKAWHKAYQTPLKRNISYVPGYALAV